MVFSPNSAVRAVASGGGQWYPPFLHFTFDPLDCCIHPPLCFKNAARPSVFWSPCCQILATCLSAVEQEVIVAATVIALFYLHASDVHQHSSIEAECAFAIRHRLQK